jgi:DNA-binding Lrp family transcriptional regulator
MTLPESDRNRLMRTVQAGVPLVEDPFGELGAALSLAGEAVHAQLRDWSESGILREISAVLEGSALGYESALVAGSVPEARLDRVVEVVNAHPTVTHNYLRSHAYNLWFTIAVPSSMTVGETLRLLARESEVPAFHALHRTASFKIGVNFDPETRSNRTLAAPPRDVEPIDVSERDRALFRALQTPLPLEEHPFAALARKAGVETGELLAFGRRHLGGAMRRYVGTLRHRKLGVRENGMAVFRVEGARAADVGKQLAEAPEVSHCYARNAIPGFPYTLYAMLHGPSRESCQELAAQLARQIGGPDYAVLFSVKEFKKVRLRYFLPELDRWCAELGGR